MRPVANAMNVLQAYVYKSVNTGLFIKSLVATSFVKFIVLLLNSIRALPKKSKNKQKHFEFDNA